MSFKSKSVNELREIADSFGVDLDGVSKKADIISAITEEGVTWQMYVGFESAERADPEEAGLDVFHQEINLDDPANTVLVKMTRTNMFYQVDKYTFTKEHPFVAMSEDDAQEIFDREDGFVVATPNEVKKYYG